MNICKNCNSQTDGDYCSNCGHPVKLNKIDKSYVAHEINNTLFTDKGFFYTTVKILSSPGDSVKHYITEDRSRYVKPVTYLIITSLILTLISHFLKIDYIPQFKTTEPHIMQHLQKWIMENKGYVTIMIDLFMAFWIRLVFRKSDYNLFEVFVLMCYLSGVKALFLSVAIIVQAMIPANILPILIFVSTIYTFWGIGQFFDKKKATSYLKAVLAFLLGIFIITLIVAVVMFIGQIVR
ncbi:MAG: DUF3667 domain-containing protein [Bacteroidales bacterium]|jgi:hypothetical protein|nr:DUF3667 domain-containing protein [Bacteroidales bacterium]